MITRTISFKVNLSLLSLSQRRGRRSANRRFSFSGAKRSYVVYQDKHDTIIQATDETVNPTYARVHASNTRKALDSSKRLLKQRAEGRLAYFKFRFVSSPLETCGDSFHDLLPGPRYIHTLMRGVLVQ
jgi:hypothetical protein